MTKRSMKTVDAASAALILLLVALAFAIPALGARDALVVWSCGGNYRMLSDFVPRFEETHDCSVTYIAAPVQYLLERAVYGDGEPDVIVGRGGPGWLALKQADKMQGNPTFFAVDPLVVAVAPNNPAGIEAIQDVARDGIRVSWTPESMRPKSKVPGLFMASLNKQFPGAMDGWVRNAIESGKCGMTMLEPLIAGDADVAIAPQTLTTYEEYAGKVDTIPIDPKHLLAMSKGKASMPQCAAWLTTSPRTALAQAFVDELAGEPARELLREHGYIPLLDQEARPFDPMMQIKAPKDFPAWMTRTAQLLARCGATDEARRRYLMVINIAGPSHYSCRARYRLGELASDAGEPELARRHWQRVIDEYPPKPPVEYDSEVLQVGKPVEGVDRMAYEHWIGLAQESLAQLPPATQTDRPSEVRETPMRLLESDPPKSGKRWLALGEDHFRAGDPRYAVRDTLKVCTLNHPSPHIPEAEYNLGVYEAARGNMDLAIEQWQRTAADYPKAAAADAAEAALASAPEPSPTRELPPMPPRMEGLASHPLRSMTYGLRLYHHRLPLYAFKEMLKIIHGGAAGTDLAAEARLRAGIACLAMGLPDAAARQWALCQAHYPDSEWAAEAASRLAELPGSAPTFEIPPPPEHLKAMGPLHYTIGEELHLSGITQDDEVLLQYLKPLTTAMPKDPESPLMAKAAVQAAVFLRETQRPACARSMLELAVSNWPDAPPTKKARAMIKAIDETKPGGPA